MHNWKIELESSFFLDHIQKNTATEIISCGVIFLHFQFMSRTSKLICNQLDKTMLVGIIFNPPLQLV